MYNDNRIKNIGIGQKYTLEHYFKLIFDYLFTVFQKSRAEQHLTFNACYDFQEMMYLHVFEKVLMPASNHNSHPFLRSSLTIFTFFSQLCQYKSCYRGHHSCWRGLL